MNGYKFRLISECFKDEFERFNLLRGGGFAFGRKIKTNLADERGHRHKSLEQVALFRVLLREERVQTQGQSHSPVLRDVRATALKRRRKVGHGNGEHPCLFSPVCHGGWPRVYVNVAMCIKHAALNPAYAGEIFD